jgi:hypothetical protein
MMNLAKILLCWVTGLVVAVSFVLLLSLITYLFQTYPIGNVISMFFGVVVFPVAIGALLLGNVLWKDKE